MGVDFNNWLQGCGYQFFHNIDRYGQFNHSHIFVASMDDMTDILSGLTGCDEDSFCSTDTILKLEKKGCCFIGYDKDPVEALKKCIEKLNDEKRKLDEEMDHEEGEE